MHFYSEDARQCLFCESTCAPADSAPAQEGGRGGLEGPQGEGLLLGEGVEGDIIIPDDNVQDCSCSCQNLQDNPLLGAAVAVGGMTPKGVGIGGVPVALQLQLTLKYAFVLGKLLDYPQSKCLDYLKRSEMPESDKDGGGGGGGWFSVCKNCSELVQEGHSIYHVIEDLTAKMMRLKEVLKERIVISTGPTEHGVEEQNQDREEGDDDGRNPVPGRSKSIYLEVRKHVKHHHGRLEPAAPISPRNPSPLNIKTEVHYPVGDENEASLDYENDDSNYDFPNSDPFEDPANESGDAGETGEEELKIDLRKKRRIIKKRDLSESESDYDDEVGVAESTRFPQRKSPRSKRPMARYNVGSSDDSDSDKSLDDYLAPTSGRSRAKKKSRIASDIEEMVVKPEMPEKPSTSTSDSNVEGPKKCRKCCAVYISKHKLRDHEKLHHRKSGVMRCKKCSYVCKSRRALGMHNNKEHAYGTDIQSQIVVLPTKPVSVPVPRKKVELYPCDQCPYVYKTSKIKAHKELHARTDVLRCEKCGYVCEFVRAMKIHFTKYHKGDPIKGSVQKPTMESEGESGSKSAKSEPDCQTDDDNYSDVEDFAERTEFMCKICNAEYKTLHRLKEHLQLHKNPSAIKCPNCPFVCMTEVHLFRHENKRHRESESYRERQKAKNRRDHARKKAREHEGGPFQCDHCPSVYEMLHSLKYHVRRYHPDKLLQCDKCEDCFESKQVLEIHQTKYCKLGNETSSQLLSDAEGNSREIRKPYVCEHCAASFKTNQTLHRHIADMHSKDKFPCPECSVSFPTAKRLRYHKARTHADVHNVCTTCGYKARGAYHLRLHMHKHTKEKMAMCEICSKTFVSPTYLTSHKIKEHSEELGVEPFKCNDCDMKFPSKAVLKYHILKVHEQKFKFFCESCGKGFLFKSSLKSHSLAHATERNQTCQYCGAAYVHQRTLMDHMKSHHPEEFAAMKGLDPTTISRPNVSNEGPFNCKFCQEEFEFRWALQKHLKTHTEIFDKYKCATCGRGYSSQAGLNRHEETAHTDSTFSCSFCASTFPCRDYLRYHIKNYCRKKRELDASTASMKTEPNEGPQCSSIS